MRMNFCSIVATLTCVDNSSTTATIRFIICLLFTTTPDIAVTAIAIVAAIVIVIVVAVLGKNGCSMVLSTGIIEHVGVSKFRKQTRIAYDAQNHTHHIYDDGIHTNTHASIVLARPRTCMPQKPFQVGPTVVDFTINKSFKPRNNTMPSLPCYRY